MLAPSTVVRNTGSSGYTISVETSVKKLTHPSAHTVAGNLYRGGGLMGMRDDATAAVDLKNSRRRNSNMKLSGKRPGLHESFFILQAKS